MQVQLWAELLRAQAAPWDHEAPSHPQLHEEETDPKGTGDAVKSELSTGKELDPGTASAQAGPAENQVRTVSAPFGNAAEAGAVPCDSLLPNGISGGSNATAATHTVSLPYAECPRGCAAVLSPCQAGHKRRLPRICSTSGDPVQRQQQAPTPQPSLAHQPGHTWEMLQPSPWQAGEPWEEPQISAPSPCPSSQPCLELPTASTCPSPVVPGLALPGRVPSPTGSTGRLGGCVPAAPRRGLRRSRHRPADTACRSNATV